jgi:hypothetical protein
MEQADQKYIWQVLSEPVSSEPLLLSLLKHDN